VLIECRKQFFFFVVVVSITHFSETDHSETHVKIQGSCLKIRVSKALKQVEKEKVEQSLEAAKAEAVDPCDSEIWRLNRTPKRLRRVRQTLTLWGHCDVLILVMGFLSHGFFPVRSTNNSSKS